MSRNRNKGENGKKKGKVSKAKKSKLKWYIIGVIFVLILVLFFVFKGDRESSSSVSTGQRIVVTPENFPAVLTGNEIIQSMPKNARINIIIGEMEYSIIGREAHLGLIHSADMTIRLPENYFNNFEHGFCNALSGAVENGDLVVEKTLTDTKLIWKYKKMFKYKDCIG
jgi:hypothetical protein